MKHPKRHFYRGKKRTGRFERGRQPPKIKAGADTGLKKVFAGIGVPAQKPFKPDPFQLQALSAVKRSDCLVTVPTGAGKTWIAELRGLKNWLDFRFYGFVNFSKKAR